MRLRGFDVELLDQSARSIVQTVLKAGSKVAGPVPLPTRINRFTVLKSPFVHKKFKGQIYALSKDEGGRHSPFFSGYRPQFFFRTTDVTGSIVLPEDRQMVMPGDNLEVTVELLNAVAMDRGLRFAVREGGSTVASGRVVEIIE